ncbi:hypothetical protein P5485_018340 [Bacillus pumilus]|nr:hypothetical protein [Bacillus pumilus]MCY7678786.1 hypothetical protein [Bacillus pumilus]MDH3149592.1 hypothetical protein [Bacillus pumilus]
MKKWLITSAILTLLITTGVSIGVSIQKDSQSAQSQDIIQKRDRGTNP